MLNHLPLRLRPRGLRVSVVIGVILAASAAATAPASADEPLKITSFTTSVLNEAGDEETQAGAHPFSANADFTLATRTFPSGRETAVGHVKSVVTDLPSGFVGNPTSVVAECNGLTEVAASNTGAVNACPNESMVGFVVLQTDSGSGTGAPASPVPVFLLKPGPGSVASFGFNLVSTPTLLNASVRSDGDFGVRLKAPAASPALYVKRVAVTLCGEGIKITSSGFGGISKTYSCAKASDPPQEEVPPGQPPFTGITAIDNYVYHRSFLTNPATECPAAQPATTLTVNSWEQPDQFWNATALSPPITGCDRLTFEPAATIEPSTPQPDAPTGLNVALTFPTEDNAEGLAPPALKKAVVKLPEGMTINPAGANGLDACTDADLKLKSKGPVACPDAAKVGAVTAKSPVLKETLSGGVYIRSQNSDDPESGEMFRLALILENKERGLSIRLPGSIRVDKTTGQLVTTFDNNPELPVSDIKLKFKSGPRAPLATPSTCGPKTTTTQLDSWGGQSVTRFSTFQVPCVPGLGWFGPYFSAGTVSPIAGAHSPFALRIGKPDGQADMNKLALVLPEGLLANLKGNVGTRVGTAHVAAGPGSSPFWLDGPVVLEGPYGDAPFSLRVTVPAIAGPFNLGDVVVRQKIYVDPTDAHVTVVSDPLPTIVKGVPVRLQNLSVDVDKPGFMLNPTSCAPKAISGTLGSVNGQFASVSSRFQVGGCENLPLRPKMRMNLIGSKEIKRGKHPKLSTTLTQQPGESGLKSVKVRLPLSLALDPDNAEALCKPEQAAAKACPAGSIVGKATAVSPVLNRPLTGDVFFVEGTRQSAEGRTVKTLPKLWVALRGEVALDVWADSAISKGKYLVTTFPTVPDAPISSFKLDINGGDHGILAVTGDADANLCQQRLITDAEYTGQNGKQVKTRVHMDSPCGFKVRKKSVSISHARVTVSGLGTDGAPGAGKLTISGKGIHKASRTIKHSNVATMKPLLTATGKRLYRDRKAIRLRVTWNPKAKGEKTKRTTTVVKRAKKASSSTRGHGSSRTR